MNKLVSNKQLQLIESRWRIARLIESCLISLAISVVIVAICIFFDKLTPYWVGPLFLVILLVLAIANNFWQIKDQRVIRFLDHTYPVLEESSGLLIKPEDELTGLEVLQKGKVGVHLEELKVPFFPNRNIYTAGWLFCFSLLVYAFLSFVPSIPAFRAETTVQMAKKEPLINDNIPKVVSSFRVVITPPAYTRSPIKSQKQLSIKVESGSVVDWRVETSQPVKNMKFIFNNSQEVVLRTTAASPNEWKLKRKITEQGFYQIEIDGVKSDLYQIEIIADLPVRIKVSSPKQHTTIDVGQPQKVTLKVSLVDDYGITNAFIAATMASGKGEGVSFTEKKVMFDFRFKNQVSADLTKVIDLRSLGMKPGDELYFYVSSTDNKDQTSRSDVYFVSIVDTTELMSLAGMSNGVNLVPEYFRSQRQIIIDTEKLLKEQSSIPDQQFKARSNEIGIDQKLLRLRYGKFLGEESDTEIGADHDHKDGDHDEKDQSEQKFGDVKAIMDQYAHKHDVAEDATFFEPGLKMQLKAVLTEMWGSELRLRTYKPQDALPYEYKALRLLKDLQQKSRAYVAKTTVKTSQLKLEKRLSGELDKILSPVLSEKLKGGDDRELMLRQSLAILEIKKSGLLLSEKHLETLRRVGGELIVSASTNPAMFLPALKGLRKLMTGSPQTDGEISTLQHAIIKLIQKDLAKPVRGEGAPGSSLYNSYYKNLKRGGE
ncbi:MAG: DUF4175 family protein [Pedobacter sp.]